MATGLFSLGGSIGAAVDPPKYKFHEGRKRFRDVTAPKLEDYLAGIRDLSKSAVSSFADFLKNTQADSTALSKKQVDSLTDLAEWQKTYNPYANIGPLWNELLGGVKNFIGPEGVAGYINPLVKSRLAAMGQTGGGRSSLADALTTRSLAGLFAPVVSNLGNVLPSIFSTGEASNLGKIPLVTGAYDAAASALDRPGYRFLEAPAAAQSLATRDLGLEQALINAAMSNIVSAGFEPSGAMRWGSAADDLVNTALAVYTGGASLGMGGGGGSNLPQGMSFQGGGQGGGNNLAGLIPLIMSLVGGQRKEPGPGQMGYNTPTYFPNATNDTWSNPWQSYRPVLGG